MMSVVIDKEKIMQAASRWQVHSRTIRGWVEKGEKCGEVPPLWEGDPALLVEWYKVHVGRKPSGKVLDRVEELRRELGLSDAPEVSIDLGPVELLERALARLGLPLTLARVVQEEEEAHACYRAVVDSGRNADAARKRWRDATEMKRAVQRNDDCLAVAGEALREWVRKVWEPKEREIRERISGAKMGRAARDELMATRTGKDWELVWDEYLREALAGE
jgi:hypothetical protein